MGGIGKNLVNSKQRQHTLPLPPMPLSSTNLLLSPLLLNFNKPSLSTFLSRMESI
uniref:Uncharacterized protein MANES_06G063900 n=1 Tax=Rhizophora mucronata TaxID=61149 RepID=A0A2P2IUW0_RHIMU